MRQNACLGRSGRREIRAAQDLRARAGAGEAEAAFEALAEDAPAGYRRSPFCAARRSWGSPTATAPSRRSTPWPPTLRSARLFQDVARLRAGLLRADVADKAELEQRLGPLLTAPSAHSARETLALAALKRGDFESAGRFLDQLVVDPDAPARLRQRAEAFFRSCAAAENFRPPQPGPARRPHHAARSAAPPPSRMTRRPRPWTTCMTFTVAIIGRPNVGKSTLFNRLVGKKLALVDDQPGVTRDRRAGDAKLGDLNFTIIDTAGLEEGDAASLTGRMRAQTEAAIDDADAIFFLIDARAGVTPEDRHFAALVRRAGKPVILIANKAEGRAGEAGAYEAFDLGLGDPVALSAEHGDGFAELYRRSARGPARSHRAAATTTRRREKLVLADDEDGSELDLTKPLRIAVVGRPNAGKSTLINRLLGEERLLVGPEAGHHPRFASASILGWARPPSADENFRHGRPAQARQVEDKLEKLAAADALRAVRFAEVVVVLLDATIPFEKQDLTIVDLVAREGRALVIGLNKWDLIDDKARTRRVARGGDAAAAAGERRVRSCRSPAPTAGPRRADAGDLSRA